jgi:hypothetical protein
MAIQSIEVKDTNIDGVKLELTSGREVQGSIKNEDGSPARQCPFVSFYSPEGVTPSITQRCSDGKLTLRDVRPFVYVATANSQNLPANLYIESIRYAGREIPRTGIDFAVDGEFEVVLGASAATLEGAALDGQGKPAGGAAIVIAPADGSELRTGNADVHGNFYFPNLRPGDYRVYAWEGAAPDTVVDTPSLAPFAASAKAVKLGGNAHEKLQLTAIAPR